MTHAARGTIVGALLAVLAAVPGAGWAQERIVVDVAGVSCPFCAFGLEKKLQALPGVEKVTIKVNEGVVEIEVAEGHQVTKEQIQQAVKDAGFTPGEVRIEAGEGSKEREGTP